MVFSAQNGTASLWVMNQDYTVAGELEEQTVLIKLVLCVLIEKWLVVLKILAPCVLHLNVDI